MERHRNKYIFHGFGGFLKSKSIGRKKEREFGFRFVCWMSIKFKRERNVDMQNRALNYDNVFRTMKMKHKRLFVSVINDVLTGTI